MIKNTCSHIVNKLSRIAPIGKTDEEKIVYTLTVMLSDLSKFAFLLILSVTLAYATEFIVAFIFTTILRVIIGGTHFKTYWGCFIFSLCYFTFLIAINEAVANPLLIIAIFTIAVIIVFIFAPMTTKQRENIRKIDSLVYKVAGLAVCLLYLLIYLLTKNLVAQLGLWTVILQSIQLFTMKGVNFYEKSYS